jgi:hypothetical protein
MNVLLERLKAIHAAHFKHISPAYLMSGLALLIGAIILTVFIRVHPAEPPAPSPALLAERASEAQPLMPVPEPANPSGNITLSATPLPTGNILSSIPVGVAPDPLLADHSQRLDNLETLTAGLKTELAEVEVKLNQCQTTAEDLKKLQAKPPTSALPRTTTQTTRRNRHKLSRHLPRQRRQQAADVQPIPLTKPFVVEAINTWGAAKRIVVKSAYSRHYQHLKVGDPLSKWTIAAVDGQQITLKNRQGRAIVTVGTGKQP